MRKAVLIIACTVFMTACATQRPVARPGISAKPPAEAKGYLVYKQSDLDARLISMTKTIQVASRAGEPYALPPGEYTVCDIAFVQKDAAGQTWKVLRPGSANKVVVESGKTSSLDLGLPLKLSVVAAKASEGGRRVVQFRPVITGAAGEQYPIAGIRDGRNEAPLPKIELRDGAGKVLTQAAFQFG